MKEPNIPVKCLKNLISNDEYIVDPLIKTMFLSFLSINSNVKIFTEDKLNLPE